MELMPSSGSGPCSLSIISGQFPHLLGCKQPNSLVTGFLKWWMGLTKSANTSCLLLPKSSGGLQLPLVSTTFNKLQCSKAASLMSSRDPLVRHLASQKTLAETSAVRQNFRPYQQVGEVLRENPGANRKAIAQVKRVVVQADMRVHLEPCRSLVVQGLVDCGEVL